VTARINVVAHERHAVGREAVGDERQQAVPDLGRNPGIDPVRDDVVEPPGIRRKVGEIVHREGDVPQLEALGRAPPRGDRCRREVETDELAPRQPIGHRQQVCRIAARDLKYAAALDRRGRHPEERGDCREPVRVRIGISTADVEDVVVSGHSERRMVGARISKLYVTGNRRAVTGVAADGGRIVTGL